MLSSTRAISTKFVQSLRIEVYYTLKNTNLPSISQYDSEAAAEQFGTGAKAASFRRQMWNIITKIKNYEEDLTEANESNAGSPEPKSKTGGKRKAAAEEDAGQEGKVKKASKTKKKPEIKEELETDEQSGGEASGNPL